MTLESGGTALSAAWRWPIAAAEEEDADVVGIALPIGPALRLDTAASVVHRGFSIRVIDLLEPIRSGPVELVLTAEPPRPSTHRG